MKIKIVVMDLEIPPRFKRWLIRLGIPVMLALGGAAAWAATVHTWNTGDVLNAADLNGSFQALQDQITALQAKVHAPSAFEARLTASPNPIPNAVSTVLAFDSVLFDLAGEYNKTTGIFTATSAGTYLITCQVDYIDATNGAPADWIAVLFRNGFADQLGVGAFGFQAVGSQDIAPEATVIVQLAANDQITCAAYQNSGAAVPLDVGAGLVRRNVFSAARLY